MSRYEHQTSVPHDASLALSRRGFLGSGAALSLSFVLPLSAARHADAQTNTFAPSAWLRITPDNRITVVCGSSEMGQGVLTAIPMLVAEELDADWSRVSVEQAPADPAYNNPMFRSQGTGGSTTVRGHWTPLRQAGAAAREMLLVAAARQWGLEVAQLRTERSHVLGPGGRKLAYGALVQAASALPVPAAPQLKAAKDFRILGKPTRRLDTAAKTKGSAQYGIDVRVEGMLVAVMARAPIEGAKALQYDEAAARAVPGVRQVIAIPNGIAVLADGFWAAQKGRDALQARWDLGRHADLSATKLAGLLDAAVENADAIAVDRGNLRDAAANAAATLGAAYEVPYLAHACMEPMNCLAWVNGDELTIWAGTQTQGSLVANVAKLAGVDPARVKLHTQLLGGGFGRRFAPDFAGDATLLSKASGRPVKLIYTREDDMAAGYYRPASKVRFEASLDAQGRASGLRIDIGCPPLRAQLPAGQVDRAAAEGLSDQPYAIDNQRVAWGRADPGPQVWFWRSVGHSQNCFFMESFVDEMAHAAKADPLQFRLKLLADKPRHRAVLQAAADKAGWGKPRADGRKLGIALAESFGSIVAEVAEVSVAADGTPRVHKVVAAVDCGQTVNPLTIERQIESAIAFGLTAALYGRISHKDGRVEQGNFHDYPLLRIGEMPKVEVQILPSQEAPGGIGEPGTPPIAPAVCNAIFAATGVRVRRLPIDTAALARKA
jgi:isoquinoline 1-oxidoreductase beta subunit